MGGKQEKALGQTHPIHHVTPYGNLGVGNRAWRVGRWSFNHVALDPPSTHRQFGTTPQHFTIPTASHVALQEKHLASLFHVRKLLS